MHQTFKFYWIVIMKPLSQNDRNLIREAKIAAVVPAYNEEKNIAKVINTMPDFVDHIVIIDDFSSDKTIEAVRDRQKIDERVVLIEHEENQGVGGAIASGYEWARDNDMDAAVVMAGDAQMDPEDLPQLLIPVIRDDVHYSKGNRLLYPGSMKLIPQVRFWGNSMLSLLTKIASGYWHSSDSQCGYTVIHKVALHAIDWQKMYKRYGQPNDLLVSLNINNFTVKDVPVYPRYNVGEISGISIKKVLFTISQLLVRRFFDRMITKYVIYDFHPLVLFYFIAFFLMIVSILFFGRVVWIWSTLNYIPSITFMAALFTSTTSLQSFFFAMWMDMEANKSLRG